jgi:Fe2+ or Zn2+ uptake regulation protein
MSERSSEDIVNILRKHGLVVTPHRYKMIEYFMAMGSFLYEVGKEGDEVYNHLCSASVIYYSLLEDGYFISLSSVYKNLCLFRSRGLILPDVSGL